ncbi:cytochrome P450 [Nonomuraea basaltis]|uniref:cytochrome P450 n=1 Tax=Nonomuraea basaltis TaxID=2495887 RepID=UPI00110C488A|nr:cytochrome P450 [Nonomuraea basaltis]TMR97147.1 cytochrome P450 [Nonomuraea basaltis]
MTDTPVHPGYPDHVNAVRLYGPMLGEDPAELYQRMRREGGPVVPVLLDDDIPAWFVMGYRELHHVFSQSRMFGRDSRRWNMWEHIRPDWPLMPGVGWQPTVLFAEGPERQRRSGAIGDALDGLDRTELAMLTEQVADTLIDVFAGDGRADLLARYAQLIPARVIVGLFGLPEADAPELITNFNIMLDATSESGAAYQWIIDYMGKFIVGKRAMPGEDLPSRLIEHSARLTDEEIALDLLAVVGSSATTSSWIGNTLHLMLVDDRFSITLQGGRSSVGQAMNEVLWKEPPLRSTARWATQDCELGGRRVRRGDMLVLGLAAANADPQVQPVDDADTGTNRAHMSFGHGEYGCSYPAPELAEIIAKTAVEVLLDRLPDVDLAVSPGDLGWRRSLWMRTLESLPVHFAPTAPLGHQPTWDTTL